MATMKRLWWNNGMMPLQIQNANADECRCIYCTAYSDKLKCASLRDIAPENTDTALARRDDQHV